MKRRGNFCEMTIKTTDRNFALPFSPLSPSHFTKEQVNEHLWQPAERDYNFQLAEDAKELLFEFMRSHPGLRVAQAPRSWTWFQNDRVWEAVTLSLDYTS